MKKIVLLIILFVVLLPAAVLARIGVGVGNGKIYMEDKLKAGNIYDVPPITVINTGDQASDYEMSVAFHRDQPELWPEKEWFKYEPQTFFLDPGKSQVVNVQLTLPIKGLEPGDYFAFLEARPVKKSTGTGGSSIGVAAATKFYFTVEPANFFLGLYYRVLSLFRNNAPWSYVVLAVVVMATLIVLFKSKFSFEVNVGRKDDGNKETEDSKDKEED